MLLLYGFDLEMSKVVNILCGIKSDDITECVINKEVILDIFILE